MRLWKSFILIFIFLTLIGFIGLVFLSITTNNDFLVSESKENSLSISSLKVKQVELFIQERMLDSRIFFDNEEIKDFIRGEKNSFNLSKKLNNVHLFDKQRKRLFGNEVETSILNSEMDLTLSKNESFFIVIRIFDDLEFLGWGVSEMPMKYFDNVLKQESMVRFDKVYLVSEFEDLSDYELSCLAREKCCSENEKDEYGHIKDNFLIFSKIQSTNLCLILEKKIPNILDEKSTIDEISFVSRFFIILWIFFLIVVFILDCNFELIKRRRSRK